MSYGFIYCLTNDCMPGICKIGFTDRAPSQRCKELSSSTSVPVDFNIQFYVEVEAADALERQIHAAFDELRVNSAREFFSCAPAEVYHWLMRNADFETSYLDGDCNFELQKLIDAHIAARQAIKKASSVGEDF